MRNHKQKKMSFKLIFISLIIVAWSLILGTGMAKAFDTSNSASFLKSVDPPTQNFQVAQELYLENCSSCHIPIPPAVLPTETWKEILERPLDHYGTKVDTLVRLTQVIIWNYVSAYSRSLMKDEVQPKFIAQSRYFAALHPKVALPNPVTHRSCVACHPNAISFDYRTIDNEDS